jgi:hypothetical protein
LVAAFSSWPELSEDDEDSPPPSIALEKLLGALVLLTEAKFCMELVALRAVCGAKLPLEACDDESPPG